MFKRFDLGVIVLVVAAAMTWYSLSPPSQPAATQDVSDLVGTCYNVTLTNADTEYSQALPTGCRYFTMQARTSAAVRWTFETGKVATPTAPYMTMKAGGWNSSPELYKATGKTLYLGTASAGTVVEIMAYN